jgi:4-diphosphocytidyl-2-C-methyl-D-erythritol kinase
LIVFPNCKINLGLSVLRKRPDGFHDLETIFYPVKILDALEIITRQHDTPEDGSSLTRFHNTGLHIDGDPENNLCIKAYHLLKRDFPQLPPVHVYLHKTIPMGAGLGGGSADGAFALRLLNDKYSLNLSKMALINYAAKLGSDCPFFIINKACLASSRGEMLEEIELDLSAYQLILVHPGVHVNTGWAFSQIVPHERKPGEPALSQLISQSPGSWKNHLVNDFEIPVFAQHPELRLLRDELYEKGALYASMSGSGSTIFGIFEKGLLPQFNFPASYKLSIT